MRDFFGIELFLLIAFHNDYTCYIILNNLSISFLVESFGLTL